MTTRLSHRGPDDHGYACIDPDSGRTRRWGSRPPDGVLSGVLIGHRRLSILDLGPGGQQPMFSDDGACAIAYNGEIYNYVELRRELEAQGVALRSRCDTEVLLRAYERWGEDAFGKFNGMWAFTLWDGRTRTLVASRDRFGVKPLYYARVDGTWVFASEIKAVLAFPDAFLGFNEANVRRFANHGRVDCDDTTFFEGIRSVPPGTFLLLNGGRLVQRRYWTLTIDGRHEGQSADVLARRYRELLDDSIRLRVRSDVPIGTMLSGGLDSTSITALVQEQRGRASFGAASPELAGLRDFHHVITACWPGRPLDEEALVSEFCAGLDLTLHKVHLTGTDLADVFENVVYHLDEPFENPTTLVQYWLMKKARELGVKVVLNGHGSDEVLAGYPEFFIAQYLARLLLDWHPWRCIANAVQFRKVPGWTGAGVLREMRRAQAVRGSWLKRPDPATEVDATFGADSEIPGGAATFRYKQKDMLIRSTAPSVLQAISWRQVTTTLLPQWLRMEDRMSMAHSVESRQPFLDYRLVEFGFNLPDELKLRDGFTKFTLRDAMRDLLPASIVDSRIKRRFASPFPEWIRNEWRELIESALLGDSKLASYVDGAELRDKLRRRLAGEGSAMSPVQVWRALGAELCLRRFAGRDPGHAAPIAA